MKKLFKLLTNKVVVTLFFLLLQIAFTVGLLVFLTRISAWVYIGCSILSLFVCLFIMGKDANPGYKLAWVIPILLFPLFGGLLYISFGRTARLRRRERKFLGNIEQETANCLSHDKHDELAARLTDPQRKLATLCDTQGGYPIYENCRVTYYPTGEALWEPFLSALRAARRYIFLEYFIIESGRFWNSVLQVLLEKVAEGVDVRLIYDDVGCLFTLPKGFAKKLRAAGVRTMAFNKLKPTFNIRMNNRTHRKITVIDGAVAFTGGINLADEYVNEVQRFGRWKDTAIKIEGEAAKSFAVMFMQFWLLLAREHTSIDEFLPSPAQDGDTAQGFVQPVASDPGKNNQLIEKGLMRIAHDARSYVYIYTPYLIPDNEFVTTLTLAAQSGVDVRIVMPHIPDKKLVFVMSRSFYPVLLKAGVKIYEYLPGFVHAKSMLADDSVAYVGTCNLDYRSFYLHYECGAFLYDTPALADMKADYLRTLESCKEITYEEATDVRAITKLARSILRLFAPLF